MVYYIFSLPKRVDVEISKEIVFSSLMLDLDLASICEVGSFRVDIDIMKQNIKGLSI